MAKITQQYRDMSRAQQVVTARAVTPSSSKAQAKAPVTGGAYTAERGIISLSVAP